MNKYFFSAKNIEDYRRGYNNNSMGDKKLFIKNSAGEVEEKIIDETTDLKTKEIFEQQFFLTYLKGLFRLSSNEIFEHDIFCETGIEGLRFDFNFGLRLEIPKGNFRVRIGDADSGEIYFDRRILDGVRLLSVEQYFIRWQFEVFRDNKKVFAHTLNLKDKPVSLLISGGLGDQLALLSFAREFKKRHKCRLAVCIQDYLRDFVANLYPELYLVDKIYFKTYATYYPTMILTGLGITPTDFRNMPFERFGGMLLGLKTIPAKPIFRPTAPPVTREPYICIGVQASGNRKGWLYPDGWDIVVDYLKSLGYRVFCIDKKAEQKSDDMTISKPEGAEDFTGDFSIMERANMLHHAEFFIGLGSGLAWVANAVNCPVVLVCGFSQNWCEFYTPYRVINRLVCNGCFNDIRVNYLVDFCPRHKGTPRELECQKKIHPRQVINAINRLICDKDLTPPIARNR